MVEPEATELAPLIGELEAGSAAGEASGHQQTELNERLLAALRSAEDQVGYLSSVLVERLLAGRSGVPGNQTAYELAAVKRINADALVIARLRKKLKAMEELLGEVRQSATGNGPDGHLLARIDAALKEPADA